jgi:hypothetical protein
MKKPDAEQFARIVLWNLASIRADVVEFHTRLAMLEGKPPSDESFQEQIEKTRALRDKIYFESLKVVGIDPQPPSTPTRG